MKALKFVGKVIVSVITLPFLVCFELISLIIKLLILVPIALVLRKQIKSTGIGTAGIKFNIFAK